MELSGLKRRIAAKAACGFAFAIRSSNSFEPVRQIAGRTSACKSAARAAGLLAGGFFSTALAAPFPRAKVSREFFQCEGLAFDQRGLI